MNRTQPGLMDIGNFVLRVAVMIAVGLLPSILSGKAIPVVAESEAPFEQGESSGKEVVVVQARQRVFRVDADKGSPLRFQHARQLALTSTRVVPAAGHRLSNNLLAPLRR